MKGSWSLISPRPLSGAGRRVGARTLSGALLLDGNVETAPAPSGAFLLGGNVETAPALSGAFLLGGNAGTPPTLDPERRAS